MNSLSNVSPLSLEVRELPISAIHEAPYNSRRLPQVGSPAYRKLEQSLCEFGLIEPLVWNETTGNLVGGHARLKILKDQKAELVPVSVVRLTLPREKALNVVLNNPEAQGRFDSARLADLLMELESLPELELTGFGADTLRNLKMEPLPELPAEPPTDCVKLTLEMPQSTWLSLQETLDQLIRTHDLVSHVQGLHN